ncbi:cupin-like domain-containing protein, partial [Pseudomonas viridiflava]|uniref:cupin-like domain-containing protein n=1 Tax=Pseudomonas viridiflava TaxID=33069 RepID=UPI00197FBB52
VVLETLLRDLEVAQPPAIYVGSTTLDTYLPGLRADNPIALPQAEPLASIWIGNRTRIAAHQDLPDNLAQLRSSIERSVPVGNGRGGEYRNLPDSIATRIAQSGLVPRLEAIKQTHLRIRTDKLECQIGRLGGGN